MRRGPVLSVWIVASLFHTGSAQPVERRALIEKELSDEDL